MAQSNVDAMIREQIVARGVRDPLVLGAIRAVPRTLFVPSALEREAYGDHPLPIGFDQTISQPFIVGFMTEALGLTGTETVLEIGTGSGYQTAILAEIANRVFSIEIQPELAAAAQERMARLHYRNVEIRTSDGFAGWPEVAPFDAIIVTAAPPEVPAALVEQLQSGGRMIVPVGRESQDLVLVTRTESGSARRAILPVRFVPMIRGASGEGKA